MRRVEVLAEHDATLRLAGVHAVDDVLVDSRPQRPGLAAQELHVDLEVDVAHADVQLAFLVSDVEQPVVPQAARAVPRDGFERLCVLACAGRSVEQHVYGIG